MDNENFEDNLSKWGGIQESHIGIIAKEFYRLSHGDARLLLQSHTPEESIYGRVAELIFEENLPLHRYLLFVLWARNTSNIKEAYVKLGVGDGKIKRLKGNLRISTNTARFCWCKGPTSRNSEVTSVQCDYCDGWFHCLCSGITLAEASSIDKFKCLTCRGGNIPAIFVTPKPNKQWQPELTLDPAKDQNDNCGSDSSQSDKEYPTVFTTTDNDDVSSTDDDFEGDDKQARSESRNNSPNSDKHLSSSDGEISADNQHDSSDGEKSLGSGGRGNKKMGFTEAEKSERLSDNEADAGESNKTSKVLDTSLVPTDFMIQLPQEDYRKVVTTKEIEIRGRKKLIYVVPEREYTVPLKKYFMAINKACVPVFKRKEIVQPEDIFAGSFLRIYAHCKGKKFGCTATYVFTLRDLPAEKAEVVNIYVRKTKGKVFHLEGQKLKLPLKGSERAKAKEALRGKFPSEYRRSRYEDADLENLAFGNYDFVQSLKIFQQARLEDMKSEDYHTNVLTDLIITYFQERSEKTSTKRAPLLEGFIQHISLIPFYVVMFCEDQMNYLWEVSKKTDVVLFFDATGSLCKKLPKPFEQKAVYYYALIIKPRSGVDAVPVLEFYSARQDVETLEACLRSFFYTYKRYCDIRGRQYKIARVEIDFSKALLASVVSVFQGLNTEGYLGTLLTSLMSTIPPAKPFIAVHICRIHVVRMWSRRLNKIFGAGKKSAFIRNFWFQWLYAYIKGKDLWSICRRITDILVISGNSYVTKQVQAVLDNFQMTTNRDGPEPWISIDEDDIDPCGPFYKRTILGCFIQQVADKVRRKDTNARDKVQAGNDLEPNKYFSVPLFDYVVRHLLPYSPIVTLCVFKTMDLPIVDDHTNPVESWIKTIRRHYLGGIRNARISRLVRAHQKIIKGQVKQAMASSGYFSKLAAPLCVDVSDESDEDVGLSNDESDFTKEYNNRILEMQGRARRSFKSPERDQEKWGKARKPVEKRVASQHLNSMPLIPWGGEANYRGEIIRMSMTCNFDCTLQILYFLYTYTKTGKDFINGKTDELSTVIHRIFALIDEKRFGQAKIAWLFYLNVPIQTNMNLEDEERVRGTQPLNPWFSVVEEKRVCKNKHCPGSGDPKILRSKIISFADLHPSSCLQMLKFLNHGYNKPSSCIFCGGETVVSLTVPENCDVVVYTCDSRWNEKDGASSAVKAVIHNKEREMPLRQSINNSDYIVAAYSMYTGSHYYAVIVEGKERFTYDGIKRPLELTKRNHYEENHGVSSVWLLRVKN